MTTAYKYEQYSKALSHAKERLRTLASRALRESWTQAKMLEERTSIFAEVPSRPYTLGAEIKGYADALFDTVNRDQTIFLYSVDGVFYTLHHNPLPNVQPWSALPLEMQKELGNCGGFYWKHSLELFFKARSTT